MGRAWPALQVRLADRDPQLLELVFAELDDFQPTAIQESDDGFSVRAFFATPAARSAAGDALAAALGNRVEVESQDVDDGDWAARSQAQLQPITIGQIVISPPWAQTGVRPFFREKRVRPLTVVIRPSMGFGTGHHATTRLMLKALQTMPVADRTVLDVGCGSGVLAIAAVGLGARSAVGVDVDPDALANARENAELNGTGGRLRFAEGDFGEVSSPADIVLANLTGALLQRSAAALARLVKPSGTLVISGFMDSERDGVLEVLGRFLSLRSIDQEDEWMAAIFSR